MVVAVNYQKAPEHKFPVPFNDAWAGWYGWPSTRRSSPSTRPASRSAATARAVTSPPPSALKARDEGGPASPSRC